MADYSVTNWFGDYVSHPSVVTEAHTVGDIVSVLRDAATYPSPVRAVGSNHSVTACQVLGGGTQISMRMSRILNIGPDTVALISRRNSRRTHCSST